GAPGRCGLPGAGEGRADDSVGWSDGVGERRRLPPADLVEVDVEAAEQLAGPGLLGAAVADDDQHEPDSGGGRVDVARGSWPVRRNSWRARGSSSPIRRYHHSATATPATSRTSVRLPRASSGGSASERAKPVSGHQN